MNREILVNRKREIKMNISKLFSRKNKNAYTPAQRRRGILGTVIGLIVTAIAAGVYYYICLPALNFQNMGLYVAIIVLSVVYIACSTLVDGVEVYARSRAGRAVEYCKKSPIPAVIIILAAAVLLVGYLVGAPLFRAKDYTELLEVKDGDFSEDIAQINWDQIPQLDKFSSNNLANRKLGELSDLVSQFTISEDSVQINYQNTPVRVTYLDYSSFFKWIANSEGGIPAYMRTDMRTQEVTVVRLDEGIKYSPSEYFERDLMRYLRFYYPTLMFSDVNFEINDDGTPYWIASFVKKTIGLFGGTDVNGVILLNAVTGECTKCSMDEIPAWVDRACDASLLIQQYDYRGIYVNGFFNSLFTQSGCTETTDGYNYVVKDDDVWMYTGVTSVTSDSGNIGFILVNQRTKEARYYSCAGAEEYSAMASAEGAVQQYGYVSTFPLLLNIADEPTYFMALKDTGGLVKMYAMVNVSQYQIVANGYSLSECQKNYVRLLGENGLIEDDETDVPSETDTVEGALTDIRSASIDGNTVFYLQLEGADVYYTVSAKDCPLAVLLNVGDTVKIEFVSADGRLTEALSVEAADAE